MILILITTYKRVDIFELLRATSLRVQSLPEMQSGFLACICWGNSAALRELHSSYSTTVVSKKNETAFIIHVAGLLVAVDWILRTEIVSH